MPTPHQLITGSNSGKSPSLALPSHVISRLVVTLSLPGKMFGVLGPLRLNKKYVAKLKCCKVS